MSEMSNKAIVDSKKASNVPAIVTFDVDTGDMIYSVELLAGNPITFCNLYYGPVTYFDRVDSTILAGYGTGVRKHGDLYNREMGFRMALKSALNWIQRCDRALFWKEYLKIFPVDERVAVPKVVHGSVCNTSLSNIQVKNIICPRNFSGLHIRF